MSAVITLAGNGSVAVIKRDSRKRVIFTWPRLPPKYVDPTGSGDAFGAGIVWSYIVFGPFKKISDYKRALSVGSYWGAVACGEYGGHAGIPNIEELLRALGDTRDADYPSICRSIERAEPLLYMLDDRKYHWEYWGMK